jgi:hypothetical protein
VNTTNWRTPKSEKLLAMPAIKLYRGTAGSAWRSVYHDLGLARPSFTLVPTA